jgi:NADP-dependent 3-hydroxy acid dehydrogenase YdfG
MAVSRTIWITGASSGIGRALAKTFIEHGDTVAVSARRVELLRSLEAETSSYAGRCKVYPCDVGDEVQIERVVTAVLKECVAIDILINCAGVTSFKDFMNTTTAIFDEVVRINLRATFLATKAVLPSMLDGGGGVIMNILSYAGKTTYTGSSAYAAAKAGAEAMMNVVRAETRGKGIKIVNVSPGAVLTPIWQPKHQERYGHMMMKPEEIANILYDISRQPVSIMVEDIIIRPQGGDLKL